MIKKCLTCDKEFTTYLSNIRRGGGKYCSRRCQPRIGVKGAHRSPNTEFKMGGISVFKGKRHMKESLKNISLHHKRPWLGKKHTEEQRKKISDAHKLRVSLGIHHLYRGGLTSINDKVRNTMEYKLWRERVFKRDKYTCKFCGARNGNGKNIYLEADHIQPFSKFKDLRFDVGNGRTLCRPCHLNTETHGSHHGKIT